MWKLEWDLLSTRIAGIIEASSFLFQTAQAGESDATYSTNILIQNCEQTAGAIQSLLLRYGGALPANARQALVRFDKWWRDTSVNNWLSSPGGFPAVQAAVVLLGSVRAELDHLLADRDEIVRSHVVRAFQHLQRSLIVDLGLRARWISAFDSRTGELSCEELGGVHLLLHGIWAFKVSATGERTDLVLGTRLVVDQDVVTSAHGLVLTEWKLIRDGDNTAQKRDEAQYQAERYTEGSLSGFELESERYLVLVGRRNFEIPSDIIKGGTKYKVVGLFLERQSPSVGARR